MTDPPEAEADVKQKVSASNLGQSQTQNGIDCDSKGKGKTLRINSATSSESTIGRKLSSASFVSDTSVSKPEVIVDDAPHTQFMTRKCSGSEVGGSHSSASPVCDHHDSKSGHTSLKSHSSGSKIENVGSDIEISHSPNNSIQNGSQNNGVNASRRSQIKSASPQNDKNVTQEEIMDTYSRSGSSKENSESLVNSSSTNRHQKNDLRHSSGGSAQSGRGGFSVERASTGIDNKSGSRSDSSESRRGSADTRHRRSVSKNASVATNDNNGDYRRGSSSSRSDGIETDSSHNSIKDTGAKRQINLTDVSIKPPVNRDDFIVQQKLKVGSAVTA